MNTAPGIKVCAMIEKLTLLLLLVRGAKVAERTQKLAANMVTHSATDNRVEALIVCCWSAGQVGKQEHLRLADDSKPYHGSEVTTFVLVA